MLVLAKDYYKKHKKKGMTTIEAVLGTLLFLFVFCALLDMVMVANKWATLTDTAKELTRTLSVQGGALYSKPAGYPSNYYNADQLAELMSDIMRAAGFTDTHWQVNITYNRVYNPVTELSEDVSIKEGFMVYDAVDTVTVHETRRIDYLSSFIVELKAEYKWKFLRGWFGDRASVLKITMPGTSEWKYNYDSWNEE